MPRKEKKKGKQNREEEGSACKIAFDLALAYIQYGLSNN